MLEKRRGRGWRGLDCLGEKRWRGWRGLETPVLETISCAGDYIVWARVWGQRAALALCRLTRRVQAVGQQKGLAPRLAVFDGGEDRGGARAPSCTGRRFRVRLLDPGIILGQAPKAMYRATHRRQHHHTQHEKTSNDCLNSREGQNSGRTSADKAHSSYRLSDKGGAESWVNSPLATSWPRVD